MHTIEKLILLFVGKLVYMATTSSRMKKNWTKCNIVCCEKKKKFSTSKWEMYGTCNIRYNRRKFIFIVQTFFFMSVKFWRIINQFYFSTSTNIFLPKPEILYKRDAMWSLWYLSIIHYYESTYPFLVNGWVISLKCCNPKEIKSNWIPQHTPSCLRRQ